MFAPTSDRVFFGIGPDAVHKRSNMIKISFQFDKQILYYLSGYKR